MLDAKPTGKVNDREFYNGWMRLKIPKPPNQSQDHKDRQHNVPLLQDATEKFSEKANEQINLN